MIRQEILNEIRQALGSVPDWFTEMPDAVLDQFWANQKWLLSDSGLTAREKALVAFGAAAAIHCAY